MKFKNLSTAVYRTAAAILALTAVTVCVFVSCSKGSGNEPDNDKVPSEGVRGDTVSNSDDSWNIMAGDLRIPYLKITDIQVEDLGNGSAYDHELFPDGLHNHRHVKVSVNGTKTTIRLEGILYPCDYENINVTGAFQGQTLIIDFYSTNDSPHAGWIEMENALNISFTVENIPSKFYLMVCQGEYGTGALSPTSIGSLFNVDATSGEWYSKADTPASSDNE